MTKTDFEVGDIVCKKNGKMPLKITSVSHDYIYAVYLHNNSGASDYTRNFKLYEDEDNTMTAKDALYKVWHLGDAREFYGTHIGTDSQGRLIVEERGAGTIHTVTKDQMEEVLPYTFSVRMNGREQHFQGTAGKVKKGDVLLYTSGGVDNFAFAVVKNLDTKSKGAKVWQGVKLVTEEI